MRKRYKKKEQSCPMCKPFKMKKAKRWKLREEFKLKEYEKMLHDYEEEE